MKFRIHFNDLILFAVLFLVVAIGLGLDLYFGDYTRLFL